MDTDRSNIAREAVRPDEPERRLAIIVCSGPEGEATQPNPTGPTYWFKTARVISGAGELLELEPLQGPVDADGNAQEPDAGYLHALATCLAESFETNSHFLPVGRYIEIRETVGADGETIYYFEA